MATTVRAGARGSQQVERSGGGYEVAAGAGGYGRLRVDRDSKAFRLSIAEIVGASQPLREAGDRLLRNAKRNARSVQETGAMRRNIRMFHERSPKSGVPVDWVVVNEDPAAANYEWGHALRRKKGGPIVGRMPPRHLMRQAVRGLPPYMTSRTKSHKRARQVSRSRYPRRRA